MKVYIVMFSVPYEGATVDSVYSSKDEAIARVKEGYLMNGLSAGNYFIDEKTLNERSK